MSQIRSLYELTLAEQEQDNVQALAAIRSRRIDINELQELGTALRSRGLRVRASVTTHPLGSGVFVCLHLWASCTLDQLADALEWLGGTGVGVERMQDGKQPGDRAYRLQLRSMDVQFAVRIIPGRFLCAMAAVDVLVVA